MDPVFRDQQKEAWKKELEEIERKRTELLSEHQKMEKKSRKVCGISRGTTSRFLEIVKKKCKRSINEWEEQKAQYEMRFRVLSGRSGDSRKAAAELDNEIQSLQASEERRGSSASQSNGCCLIQPCWSISSRWEQPRQCSSSPIFRVESAECLAVNIGQSQPLRSEGQEAWEEEWDEDERMANGWYENAAYGSVVDPAEGSDDVGGSLGGGHPSTPRIGARSQFPISTGKKDKEGDKMGDDGLP